MPPKKKPTAPANRVYKSSVPPQQSRLPLRTTRVKYGKQASKKVKKQETLTQMDFVTTQLRLDDDYDGLEIYKDETDKPKKKRRKTTGDEPSSKSNLYTQTITQLDWSFTSEPEAENSIYEIHSSSPTSKTRRKDATQDAKPQKPAILTSSRRKSAPGLMEPPQTPHKSRLQEIPSSESPATPPSRNSSCKGSTLQERSVNIPIQFNRGTQPSLTPSKLPSLRVEDTYESEDQSRIPTTPSKKSSPAKSVRWAEVDEIREIGESVPATKDGKVVDLETTKKFTTQLRDEILDSEDDDGDYELSEKDLSQEEDGEDLPPETCYGEIGLETQKLLESQERVASPCIEESHILGEDATVGLLDENHQVAGSQILGEEMQQDFAAPTRYMESQRLATQHVHAMAPRTKVSDVFLSIQPENVAKIVDRTKNHEFRRQVIPNTVSRIWIYETYPTRLLQYMAVISPAKRPGEITNEDGIGNAQFNAKDPNCGELAWEILELYELADPLPWGTIEANEWLNAPPRKPTFVRPAVLDELMANLKPPIFCRTPSTPHGLVSSSTDTQEEAEGQLLSTMILYTQQPPSPIEAPPSEIIKEEDADEERSNSTPQPSSRAAIIPASAYSNEADEPTDDEQSPRSIPQPQSQTSTALPKNQKTQSTLTSLPHPSQAETVDLSQTQSQTQSQTRSQIPSSPHPHPHPTTTEIIFESPTRPTLSSTPRSTTLPRLLNRSPPPHAHPPHIPATAAAAQPDSLVPYSMRSSQLLTRSQMLPEELLSESVPGPPVMVLDSDDDEEDEEL